MYIKFNTEFRGTLQNFGLVSSVMRLALEIYQNEEKPLCNLEHTLKNEGLYRKHTVSLCTYMLASYPGSPIMSHDNGAGGVCSKSGQH